MEKAANQLGRVLYDTSQNPKLDMAVKKILSQRPILAFIVTFSAINDRAWSFQPFLPICTELTPSPQGGSRGPATYRVWAVVLQHSQCFHRLY